jgi:hypothetical protein
VLDLAATPTPDTATVTDTPTGAIALIAAPPEGITVLERPVGSLAGDLTGEADEPVAVTDVAHPALLSTVAPTGTKQWRIGAENRVWVILEERTWRIPNDSVPAEEV